MNILKMMDMDKLNLNLHNMKMNIFTNIYKYRYTFDKFLSIIYTWYFYYLNKMISSYINTYYII